MSWAGRLLVATPLLTEPTFSRTVVLLLQHGEDEGAVGVVVNRPSGTRVADVLPGWEQLAPAPQVVFEGGPVQPSAAICLGLARAGGPDLPHHAPLPDLEQLGPVLGTVDLDATPADLAEHLHAVRLFAGYAGWSPGQLEGEVEEGAWWVLETLPGDAFTLAPERLWRQVLRRQGMPLSLASTAPADASLN